MTAPGSPSGTSRSSGTASPGAGTAAGTAAVAPLAVTVLGHDRPGIIADVTGVLAALGLNLEDSTMTLLRGHFAMTLVCSGTRSAAEVETALAQVTDTGLDVSVRDVPEEDPDDIRAAASYLLTVHGADRPGIVSAVAGEVAAVGGNITDLSTRLAGGLYLLTAEVDLPQDADLAALQDALSRTAERLGVGATLRELESDEL
jgi:glycine cleavage system transcriptional repressor